MNVDKLEVLHKMAALGPVVSPETLTWVLKMTHVWDTDATVLAAANNTLCRMAEANQPSSRGSVSREDMCRGGAVQQALRCIHHFIGDPPAVAVPTAAVQLLNHLSASPNLSHILVHKGGVLPAIFIALRIHGPHSRDLSAAAARCISRLAADPGSLELLVSMGAVPAVLHVGYSHPGDLEVARSVCGTLSRLVALEAGVTSLVEGGGIDALVVALKDFPVDPDVVLTAASALNAVAAAGRHSVLLSEAKVPKVMFGCLAENLDDINIVQPLLSAFLTMSMEPVCQARVRMQCGLLLQSMQRLGTNEECVSLFVALFAVLTRSHNTDPPAGVRLVDLLVTRWAGPGDVLSFAVEAGGRFPTSHGVLRWLVELFANVAERCPGQRPRLLADGAVALALTAAPLLVAEDELADLYRLMSHVSSDPAAVASLQQVGGIPAVLSTMRQHQSSNRVIIQGANLLYIMATTSAARQQVVDEGGVPMLLAAIQSTNDHDVLDPVLQVLREVVRTPEGKRAVVEQNGAAVILKLAQIHSANDGQHNTSSLVNAVLRSLMVDDDAEEAVVSAMGLLVQDT